MFAFRMDREALCGSGLSGRSLMFKPSVREVKMKPVILSWQKHKLTGSFGALYGALVILMLVASCAGAIYAQSFTGSINGAVTDQAGATLANASITITEVATGQSRSTTTNNQGE